MLNQKYKQERQVKYEQLSAWNLSWCWVQEMSSTQKAEDFQRKESNNESGSLCFQAVKEGN